MNTSEKDAEVWTGRQDAQRKSKEVKYGWSERGHGVSRWKLDGTMEAADWLFQTVKGTTETRRRRSNLRILHTSSPLQLSYKSGAYYLGPALEALNKNENQALKLKI